MGLHTYPYQLILTISVIGWGGALLFPCSLLGDDSNAVALELSEMPSSLSNGTVVDEFVPVDEVVSNPSIPLPDPEFDETGNWVTWQRGPNARTDGLLLVARVDPDTGDILDPETGLPFTAGGRGKIIDRGLATIELTRNGPEWATAIGGSRLLYSKLNGNNEPSLAEARFDGNTWAKQLLSSGRNRFTPEGSKDPDDQTPRVAYYTFINDGQNLVQRLAARLIDFAFTEVVAPSLIYGGAFIPNESAMLGTQSVPGGLQQVVLWDYSVNTVEQVTFDSGAKRQTPEAWLAPEIGGETVFVTQANFLGGTIARVYRHEVGTGGEPVWAQYMQFGSPDPGKPYVRSTRPFVYQGKSYISFKVQPSPSGDLGADFYITDLETDPRLRLIRKVSNDITMSRFDQEPFITANGPIIYYSEATPSGIHILHRAQTGL